MCLVCTDWEKGKLTKKEALRNLDEIEFDIENPEELSHYFEILTKVSKENKNDSTG